MLNSWIAGVRRSAPWCILFSLGLASLEAMGYCMTQGTAPSLSLLEFAQRFSSGFWIFLAAIAAMWLLSWMLLSGLGGVRRGIALFFVLGFFVLFAGMVGLLDLFYKAELVGLWKFRPFIVAGLGLLALLLSAVASLVTGRILRHAYPSPLNPRAGVLCAFVLAEAAFAVWAGTAPLPYFHGVPAWGCSAVMLAGTAFVLWRFLGTPRRRAFLLLLTLAALGVPLPWALAQPEPLPKTTETTASHTIKHVVLITIDTLRQDALGCYTPGRDNSPHLDQLARDGTIFTNTFSSAPWTMPAIASILTGMAPSVHQLTEVQKALPEGLPTLAQYMKDAGYRTAAVGFNSFLAPRVKLDRGFQEYQWFPAPAITAKSFDFGLAQWLWALPLSKTATTEGLTDHAIDWFKENGQQDSFFWIHYFDPHIPYSPPVRFQPDDAKRAAMGKQFWDLERVQDGHVGRTSEEREWIRSLYDGEVRYVDEQVGRLLDALRNMGLYDDSLIILTSDHGEEFWDHDRFEHGHTLYNELIRVPLLVKLPGEHRGAAAAPCVSTQTLLPTVLDLCGIAPAQEQILPPPLTPLLRDPNAPFTERPIVSGTLLYFDQMDSVVFGHMKYIRGKLSGHESLFNLNQDPGEHNSLAVQDPENVARGRQLLEAAAAAAGRMKEMMRLGQSTNAPLSQQDELALKALGYL